MRFYDIKITNSDGSLVKMPSGRAAWFTSYVNGQTDLNALDIEVDVSVTPFDAPIGNPYIRIYGAALQDIGQANNLNGKSIAMSAGMKKGLPLANPAQAGPIFSGGIFFAFGNWQGTTQSIDLILNAVQPAATDQAPNNIVFAWKAGTPLSQALDTTLATAFPVMKRNIAISQNLTLATDETGFHYDVQQFADYVRSLSMHILGGTKNYQGVTIAVVNGAIQVFDGTGPQSTPKQIALTDMIGQPTWVGPNQLSATFVMRGDLSVGTFVKLPAGTPTLAAVTTAASLPQFRQQSAFQGTFQIASLRHVGRFRQADGSAWATVAVCNLQPPPGSASGNS
ncbi:MAG TPA: hypothetical protein VGC09_00515 [Rhodopila sp.]